LYNKFLLKYFKETEF